MIPLLTDVQTCLLEEKLQFILDRTFSYDTQDSAELNRIIDLHYMAANSTVQNCDRVFRMRCPKHWADLDLTDDPKNRDLH